MTMSRFDVRLGLFSARFIDPLLEVTDTMEAVKVWFEDEGMSFTTADVLAATALILARVTPS